MRNVVAAGALMLAAASAAAAQEAGKPPEKLQADQRGAAPANLTLGPAVNPPIAQFVFETNKETKVGTAAFGWKTGQEQFQLSVSGPLTDGSTEPLSLDGLPSGATAKISYNHLRKRGPSRRDFREIQRLCEPIQRKKREEAVEARKKSGSGPEPPTDLAHYPCFSGDFVNEDDRADFEEYQHLYDPAFLFGLDGSFSRTKFKYMDDAFADQSEDRAGKSVTIRGGIVAPASVSVFVSYKYTNAYKAAGAPANFCSPIPDSTTTRCREIVRGAPQPIERSIANIEFRRFFGPRIATSPSVQFDFLNGGNAEVSVPIYYLGDGTGATGGVRFSYRTDKKELTAVVFVGATFGLIP